MSSQSVQLTFTLRTSANVRSVHLVGSWDSYKAQLPLSADAAGKPGSWKGTFRFQGSHALKAGSRHWYYYVVDGYHVSHDPAKEFTTEKTTGRKLNILNVPAVKKASSATVKTTTPSQQGIASGRALSPSRILHPKPTKAYASRQIREADYESSPLDELEEAVAKISLGQALSRPGSELSATSSIRSGETFSDCSDSSDASDASDSEEEEIPVRRPVRHAIRGRN